MIIPVVFFVISFLIFLYFELKERFLHAFFFKALSSISFILLWFSSIDSCVPCLIPETASMENITPFAILLLPGLVFGLIGDLVLALRKLRPEEEEKSIIFAGTCSFALGHVFYILALFRLVDFEWGPIAFSVVVGSLVFGVGIPVMKMRFGRLLVPSAFYSFLLFWVVGIAIFSFSDFGSVGFGAVFLSAAVIFALSDLVLSQIYFKGMETKPIKTINLTLYYLAQAGIAVSILFL